MRSDLLHVISPISNQVRYQRRFDLFREFVKHMHDSKVPLTVPQLTYGDREPLLTSKDVDNLIDLRSRQELWHKENLINIAVSRLPADWQ